MASFGEDLARGLKGEPIRRASWLSSMSDLRVFFRWLVRQGKIASNPVDELEIQREAVRERRGHVRRPTPSRLQMMVAQYLEDSTARLSVSTIRSRRSVLDAFAQAARAAGKAEPSQVTPEDILAFLSVSLDGRTVGASRRYHRASNLRVFFRWLARRGEIVVNPILSLELRVPPRKLRRASTHQVLMKIADQIDLETPEGLRDRAILELLYSAGLRRGEVAALDLDDLDKSRGFVTIRSGKGGKKRVTPVGTRATHWIDEYILNARSQLEDRASDGRPSTALFLNRHGRRMSGQSITARVVLWSERTDARITPHVVRHTTATEMLTHGADLRYIQEQLGHERLSTTADYAHVEITQLKEVHRKTHPAERDDPKKS